MSDKNNIIYGVKIMKYSFELSSLVLSLVRYHMNMISTSSNLILWVN